MAHAIPALAETVVRELRDLTGYDRVMVYRFDADGHGEIIAEAREPHLEAFLGRHYPATDIPQRARDLYLRNRVRLLVDVHYQPVPLVPRFAPATGEDLDMSMCTLRSMFLRYWRPPLGFAPLTAEIRWKKRAEMKSLFCVFMISSMMSSIVIKPAVPPYSSTTIAMWI